MTPRRRGTFRQNHRYLLQKVLKISETFKHDYRLAKEFHIFVEDRTSCPLYDSQTPKLLSEAVEKLFSENEDNIHKWNDIINKHKIRFSSHNRDIIQFYATKSEIIRNILHRSILLNILLYCIEKDI